MTTINVAFFSVDNNIVTLSTEEEHGLSLNDYISVRNVSSNVNGQFFVASVPTTTSITYNVSDVPNTLSTAVSGSIITTTINSSGKPGYIYDSASDTWYQLSGKVNTNANYTWTGTHLHQVPVTMEDVLILNNLSASVSASPVGGGYLYVENGALKFMGGNGTITTIASA